jgi:hypothetical protein
VEWKFVELFVRHVLRIPQTTRAIPQTSLKPGDFRGSNCTMQLDNIFGLVGTIMLLQIIDSLQFDLVLAVASLIMSDNANNDPGPVVCGYRAKLIPRNPLQFLSERQFKKEFQFAKQDIPRLLTCFQWPRSFKLANGYKFTAEICLLMVPYRFAFPSTLHKLEIVFGRSHTNCSLLVTHGVHLLYARFGVRLVNFDIELVLHRIDLCFEAISTKSEGAVNRCFGLIDGTLHLITRPNPNRRVRGVKNNNNIQRTVPLTALLMTPVAETTLMGRWRRR